MVHIEDSPQRTFIIHINTLDQFLKFGNNYE